MASWRLVKLKTCCWRFIWKNTWKLDVKTMLVHHCVLCLLCRVDSCGGWPRLCGDGVPSTRWLRLTSWVRNWCVDCRASERRQGGFLADVSIFSVCSPAAQDGVFGQYSVRCILDQDVLLQEDVELIELLDPSLLTAGSASLGSASRGSSLPRPCLIARPSLWYVVLLGQEKKLGLSQSSIDIGYQSDISQKKL